MVCDQGIDQLVEGSTVKYGVELVERQVDPVIGHTPLGKIVGADALRAIARPDLILSVLGARVGRLLAFEFVEARTHNLHGQSAILVLALLG